MDVHVIFLQNAYRSFFNLVGYTQCPDRKFTEITRPYVWALVHGLRRCQIVSVFFFSSRDGFVDHDIQFMFVICRLNAFLIQSTILMFHVTYNWIFQWSVFSNAICKSKRIVPPKLIFGTVQWNINAALGEYQSIGLQSTGLKEITTEIFTLKQYEDVLLRYQRHLQKYHMC